MPYWVNLEVNVVANSQPDKAALNKKQVTLMADVANKSCTKAFTELFSYYAPRVQSYAMRQFFEQSQAKDLVQETMSNVWNKAHLFNADKGNVSTWIFTIARNVRFDMLRKQQNRKDDISAEDLWPILDESVYMDESSDEQNFVYNELLGYVEELPEGQKRVVQAIYVQGKSQQEVADEMSIPLGTVKSRARLAIIKLKEVLREHG
jgi:RNA polymerase sigma-70 factor (ECF subfamily)